MDKPRTKRIQDLDLSHVWDGWERAQEERAQQFSGPMWSTVRAYLQARELGWIARAGVSNWDDLPGGNFRSKLAEWRHRNAGTP